MLRLEIESSETHRVQIIKGGLTDEIGPPVGELFHLAEMDQVQAFFEKPTSEQREKLENEWISWARHKRKFFVVRILDTKGRERVRVNNERGEPQSVREDKLRDKSGRPLFREAIVLGRNQVYLSPLDLYFLDEKPVLPYRPVLRFCMPLFDSHNVKRGVLALNYEGRDILQELEDPGEEGRGALQLLNSEGYWLKGATPSDEWGFVSDEGKMRTFGRRYPAAWARISTQESGSFFQDGDFFVFGTIHVDTALATAIASESRTRVRLSPGKYQWKIVSRVPKAVFEARSRVFAWWLLLLGGTILAPLLVASVAHARVRAERATVERQLQLHGSIIDSADDAVYVFDYPSWRVRFWNAGAEKLYGWSREQVLGLTIQELRTMLSSQLSLGTDDLIRELERVGHWQAQVSRKARDGTEVISVSRWTAQRGPDGNVYCFLAINHDITDLKRAEVALRKANSETELFLNAIPSLLVGLNVRGEITRWNSAAETIFGLPFDIVKDTPLSCCGVVWDGTDPDTEIRNALAEQDSGGIERLSFLRDGSRRFLAVKLTRVYSDDEYTGTLIVGADITDRIIMEAQLRQAQKLEAIGQLAAGIAHEINTPTQYVGDNTTFVQQSWKDISRLLVVSKQMRAEFNGASESLSSYDSIAREIDLEFLMEEVPRALDQSLEGLQRVASIVRAMKEFSHPGSDSKKAIDINHAIETTVTVARNEWKYVAEVCFDLDKDLPPIPCLPGEFNQVILNLLVNAAHAISESAPFKETGHKGTITVSTRKHSEWAEVEIADTGSGIPPEIRNRIFEPFFTTKDVGKGTGQGLALAHNVIVKQHSGQIWFHSEVGKGTSFYLRLPLDNDRENDSPAAIASRQLAGSENTNG